MSDADEFMKHFREILNSSDFSDVTIVSDDLKVFKGHRNILSVFSPVLKSLFKIDSHQKIDSSLYLNGINSTEINAILKYIYFNTIPPKWTKQLESAVNSLEIKALQDQIPAQYTIPSLPIIEISPTEKLDKGKNISDEEIKINLLDLVLGINESESKTGVACHSTFLASEFDNEEPIHKDYSEEESSSTVFSSSENQGNIEHITETHSNMERSREGENVDLNKTVQMYESNDLPIAKPKHTKVKLSELINLTVQPGLKVSNDILNLNTPKAIINKDAKNTMVYTGESETNVSDNILEPRKTRKRKNDAKKTRVWTRRTWKTCDQCDLRFVSNQEITKHVIFLHNGVEYKCELCNFSTFKKVNLDQHTNVKHFGMKEDTPCDQCDYNPKDIPNLIKHKKAEHEGVRYSCNFCEFITKQKRSLNDHISSIHEGNKFQCAQCGIQYSRSQKLQNHMKEVHLGEGRKYKCKFCEYHATRKANLKVHFQKMHKDLHIDAYIKAMKTNRRFKKN